MIAFPKSKQDHITAHANLLADTLRNRMVHKIGSHKEIREAFDLIGGLIAENHELRMAADDDGLWILLRQKDAALRIAARFIEGLAEYDGAADEVRARMVVALEFDSATGLGWTELSTGS